MADEITDEEYNAFLDHVEELAEARGVELDDDEIGDVFDQSVAAGFNYNTTQAAFDVWVSDNYEDDDSDEWDAPEPDLEEEDVEEGSEMHDADLAYALELAGIKQEERDGQTIATAHGRQLTSAEVEKLNVAIHQQRDLTERWKPQHITTALDQVGIKAWSDMNEKETGSVLDQLVWDANGEHRDPTGLSLSTSFDTSKPDERARFDTMRIQGHDLSDAEFTGPHAFDAEQGWHKPEPEPGTEQPEEAA